MTQITKVYKHYSQELFREHPQQFKKAKEWMDTHFYQPRLRM